MNELGDSNPGLARRGTQRPALRPAKVDRNGHYGMGEIESRAAQCGLFFQMTQHLCHHVGRIQRLSLDMHGAITAKLHFRRADKSLSGRVLYRIQMSASVASDDNLGSAIP